MKLREGLILLLLGAVWGGSFIFIRIASPVMGPIFLMEMRVLLAGLALLLYAVVTHKLPRLRSRWKSYLLLGTFNAALPFTLIAFAELSLPASLAAILNATTPLFTAVISAFWLHSRITVKMLLGLISGLIGVIILVGWSPLPLTPIIILSVCASLFAACSYGIAGVYSKIAFKKESPLTLAIGQQLGASLFLLPFSAASIPSRPISPEVIFSVVTLSLLCTSVAYLFYFRLMDAVGPTRTLSVTFLVPVFGILWGALFLKETISISWLIGLGVILFSMTCVTNMQIPVRRLSLSKYIKEKLPEGQ